MFLKNFLSTNILFDFSNYPKDSKFYDPTNKKVNGKMKEVFEGKSIGEFVELKSKMHYMKTIECKGCNTAKGVHIATEFNEFKDTLFNNKIIRHNEKISKEKT